MNGPTVVSLGAGVQSTTMLLMALNGEFSSTPDCAIFADTGWEPAAVYRHLEWLKQTVGASIPIHVVTKGNIREDALARVADPTRRFATMPLHIQKDDGGRGLSRRQCTKEYKVAPIRWKIRDLIGGQTRKTRTTLWIGISSDEAHRMKDSPVRYIEHRYPLIERGMTRADCLAWMRGRGYPTPPRSSCIGCPFHNAEEWRAIRSDTDSWIDAVAFDLRIRRFPGITGRAYLHRSLKPLHLADIEPLTAEDRISHFGNDCEGMCGV